MPQHYNEEIVGRGEAARRLRGGLWSEKLEIGWMPFWNDGVVGRVLNFLQRRELDMRRRNRILQMGNRHHIMRRIERCLHHIAHVAADVRRHVTLRQIRIHHVDSQACGYSDDDMYEMSFHSKIRVAKL